MNTVAQTLAGGGEDFHGPTPRRVAPTPLLQKQGGVHNQMIKQVLKRVVVHRTRPLEQKGFE